MASNRESGFGRYDVMLEPRQEDDGIILEFKVQDAETEKELSDTVNTALQQIEIHTLFHISTITEDKKNRILTGSMKTYS